MLITNREINAHTNINENTTVNVVMKIWCVVSGSESRLVRVPVNTAVVQGSAVTLECSSDANRTVISWFNRLCVSSVTVKCQPNDFIYSPTVGLGGSVDSTRFSVRSVNNATHVTRDIIINPTRLTDAGVYLCVENVGADVTSFDSAQLIVIGMKTTYRSSKHIPSIIIKIGIHQRQQAHNINHC